MVVLVTNEIYLLSKENVGAWLLGALESVADKECGPNYNYILQMLIRFLSPYCSLSRC